MSRVVDSDERLHAMHAWYGHGVLFGITRVALDRHHETRGITKAIAYDQYRLGARDGAAIRKDSSELEHQ